MATVMAMTDSDGNGINNGNSDNDGRREQATSNSKQVGKQ